MINPPTGRSIDIYCSPVGDIDIIELMKKYIKILGKVRPTVDGDWSKDKSYDILTIVYDKDSKKSYISRKKVPVGINILNKDYWMNISTTRVDNDSIVLLSNPNDIGQINSFTLQEAVDSFDNEDKRIGLFISFYEKPVHELDTYKWNLYQFIGSDINQFNDITKWISIYNRSNKFLGLYLTEGKLNEVKRNPEVGDYAFVGNTLKEAIVYRCNVNGKWTKTKESAVDYIELKLSGNVTVGENGNWFNDGVDTGFKAKGEDGKTPQIVVSKDNKLQVSYDGVNFTNITENIVYTQYRVSGNKLQYSIDLGKTWNDASGFISANFRWKPTSVAAGKIQISRENEVWEDLSPEFVSNSADEEDLESVIVGDNNRVIREKSVKEYNPAEFSGLGRVILRKNIVQGKNVLTQEMINKTNTIYEVRYDFDLNGAEITIPNNCTLQFEGGNLSNGTIIGNNTKIIANKEIQIFEFDRNRYYIGGSWKINKWYCSWFGAIGDGKAFKAKYNGDTLEKTNELNAFEVIIEGTDNFEPIQEALDAAYNTNIKVVELGLGSYRISKPLNIGWGEYQSIYFKGVKNGHFGDITESDKQSTIILSDTGTYGININSGYRARLSDFDILGWNGVNYRKQFTFASNTDYYVENPEDWNSERVNKLPNNGLTPMSPYAGIVTDAFTDYDNATNPYELPKPPVNIEKLISRHSTGFTMERVTSSGFCVGFGMAVGAFQSNCDFYKFYNCKFDNNVYGVASGTNQARNTALHECSIELCYVAIIDNKVGKGNGAFYGYVSNCWFGGCYKIIEYNSNLTPIVFYNCYAESIYMIGSTVLSSVFPNNIKFIDCNFKLTSSLSNPLGIPSAYFIGAALFIRTSIINNNDGILVPMFMGSGKIEDCHIIGKDAPFTRKKECLFNPYVGKFFRISQVQYDSGINNRINSYYNIIGTSATSIIQMNKTLFPKQLLHSSSSYDLINRLLTLNIEWISNTISYEKLIYVGDIIFQSNTATIYVIVKIIPNEGNNTATLLCTPIHGIRKSNGDYICANDVKEGTRWDIYSTRYRAFDNPLIIKSISGKEITLNNWDDNLKEGIILSKKHDYEHSFQFESGVIESVDKSQKKITLKYSNNLVDSFKVINGYVLAEEDSKFWEGTWVQDIIDSQNI